MAQRDPIAAYVRNARAQRRVGAGAQCSCGEARPFALIAGANPAICFACDRLPRGEAPFEEHHVYGRANGDLTLRVPINEHRARLSVAQYEWPPGTLSNPYGCPQCEAAARLRGIADVMQYLSDDSRDRAQELEKRCDHPVKPKPAPKKTARKPPKRG